MMKEVKKIKGKGKMSEVQQKKFCLVVDEVGLAFLAKVIPCLMGVEVIGMPVTDNPNLQVLVNPIPPPPAPEPEASPVEDVAT